MEKVTSPTKQRIIKIFLVLSCIIFEGYFYFNYLWVERNVHLYLKYNDSVYLSKASIGTLWFVVAVSGLYVYIGQKVGISSIIGNFLRSLQLQRFGLIGLVEILFILSNLVLFQNALYDWAKGTFQETPNAWWIPLYLLTNCFFLPAVLGFVIIKFFRLPTLEITKEERLFLITALSKPDIRNTFINGLPHNWIPLFEILKEYPKLSKILVLDNDVLRQRENYINHEDKTLSPTDYFKMLVDCQWVGENSKEIIVTLTHNPNDFDAFFKGFKHDVEYHIRKYHFKDYQVLFNLTSGSSLVSMSMAHLQTKGKRGGVYFRQDTQQLVESRLDPFSLKELYEELLETLDQELTK